MNESYMSMAEIEAKYPNEWVLMTNPTVRRRSQTPAGGVVVIHSPDRVEFLRMVGEWDFSQHTHTASWYTGKVEDDDLLPVDSETGAA